jgi:phosphatidylserine/phosphatidylglycerophosphate/cardiolipin synthase-like enzyme
VLLQPGLTCWRVAEASRLSFLIDTAAYFAAARSAMLKARRSIHLLGWAFDPETRLTPDVEGQGASIGVFLKELACARPELDVRLLVWKSALPIAASQHFFPHRARVCFHNTPVKFRLDESIPLGACHHQKVLVIDDRLAFIGGGDIATDRWDSTRHLDDDGRRTMPWGDRHGPRHEVMAMVEGEAAAALGDLVRNRWLRACDVKPEPPPPSDLDLWPEGVVPEFEKVEVGIARTEPDWRHYPLVRETERLHLAAIGAAQKLIYLENQYIASPIYAEALAARLSDPHGPEVVIVSTAKAPSWFDQMTMDRTRSQFLRTLKAADLHGRFRAYAPYTRKGRSIIVHSKVSIIDDRMLRAGSTNLNNRSAGFDTECDLALEAQEGDEGAATRAAIARYRAKAVAHFVHADADRFSALHEETGSLAAAIDALNGAGRLRPLEPEPLGPLAEIIAAFHLGDPADPKDSWRPWRRKADIEAARREFTLRLTEAANEGRLR